MYRTQLDLIEVGCIFKYSQDFSNAAAVKILIFVFILEVFRN